MDTFTIVMKATDYLESLIDAGMDYADAQWKSSERFNIGYRMIAAEYDRRCTESQTN